MLWIQEAITISLSHAINFRTMHIHSRIPQVVILLFVAVALQGCKDSKETCPAYPREETDYLPTDYKGHVFRYKVGTDTVSLTVGEKEYSSHYIKEYEDGLCISTAKVSLKSMDNAAGIDYTLGLYHNTSDSRQICLSLQHEKAFTSLCSLPVFGDNLTPYFAMTAEFEEWVSPANETYQNVHVFVRPNYETCDTLYLSKSKGLLRYAPNSKDNAQEWYLLSE